MSLSGPQMDDSDASPSEWERAQEAAIVLAALSLVLTALSMEAGWLAWADAARAFIIAMSTAMLVYCLSRIVALLRTSDDENA